MSIIKNIAQIQEVSTINVSNKSESWLPYLEEAELTFIKPFIGDALTDAIKPWRLNGTPRPYKPVGCLDCRMTGFKGRVGLYELLPVTEGIRQAMHPAVDMARIKQTAVKEGLKPLRLAGAMKVAEGLTTLEEVLRNTPQWEG